MKIDANSIAHTTWNCKYHIVFAPKYRRQVIYGKIKGDIGQIIRKLCEWKGVRSMSRSHTHRHLRQGHSLRVRRGRKSYEAHLPRQYGGNVCV